MITGESGTGKELIAKAIHRQSARRDRPFISVNCGAIPEALIESEFFGHVKGAFTGAVSNKMGLFQAADGGTLFLDEITEVPPPLQVKLLRAIQEREIRRVGEARDIKVDIRLIAASNRDLETAVQDNVLREDLFYRLNVINVEVPPLRRRREEIPALVTSFLERNRRRGLVEKRFAKEALDVLMAYAWPGNVRELENLVERVLILSPREEIVPADLPRFLFEGTNLVEAVDDGDLTLAEMERRTIIKALRRNKGNKVQTARKLGINVKTLYNKIKAYGIDKTSLLQKR
jgi:two-component system response regulator HydG